MSAPWNPWGLLPASQQLHRCPLGTSGFHPSPTKGQESRVSLLPLGTLLFFLSHLFISDHLPSQQRDNGIAFSCLLLAKGILKSGQDQNPDSASGTPLGSAHDLGSRVTSAAEEVPYLGLSVGFPFVFAVVPGGACGPLAPLCAQLLQIISPCVSLP